MAWRYFKARVDQHVVHMEWTADQFAKHLSAMRE